MLAPFVDTELQSLELGDKRLEDRARRILSGFSQAAESTPDAFRDLASLVGTYRFMKNQKVSPNAVLEPHRHATLERTREHDCVLLIQDTTAIDLSKPTRQVKGAGPMESDKQRGFYLHPLYAVSETGVPLGIADHWMWTREELKSDLTSDEKRSLRAKQVYEEKESCRWREMLQSGEQIARAQHDTQFINVADSESDIFDVFLEVDDQAENHHFLIRACQNRAVPTKKQESRQKPAQKPAPQAGRKAGKASERTSGEPTAYVDDLLAASPVLYTADIEVSGRAAKITCEARGRRKSREARAAKVEVRALSTELRGPARRGGRLPDISLNVVEAREVNTPQGAEPVRWVLFTSLPIDDIKQVKRVVSIYCTRWLIEVFFNTLKNGFGVEKLQYRTLHSQMNAVATLMIAAWRVEYLKQSARVDPQASCEKYYASAEWIPVYLYQQKTQTIPDTPPTMSEFVMLVAQLGGYIKQHGQGPPGSRTLWRAIGRIEVIVETYQLFMKAEKRCVT